MCSISLFLSLFHLILLVVDRVEVKDIHGNSLEFAAGPHRGPPVGLITLKGRGTTKSMILEYIASNNGSSNNNNNGNSNGNSSKEVTALSALEWAVLLKYLVQKSSN